MRFSCLGLATGLCDLAADCTSTANCFSNSRGRGSARRERVASADGRDPATVPAGELLRRTVRTHRQIRACRPHGDPEPAAPQGRARRIHPALQWSTTASLLRALPTPADLSRGEADLSADQATRAPSMA